MHGTIIPGTTRLPIQIGAAMPEARRITTIIPGAGEALGVGECTAAIILTGVGAVTAGVSGFHGVAHGAGAATVAGIWAGDIPGEAGTVLTTHIGDGALHTDGVTVADTGAVAIMHRTTEEAEPTEEDSTATTEALAVNMA